MFIKATRDFEVSGYSPRKGRIYGNLPLHECKAAIQRGDAVASSIEEYVEQQEDRETAQQRPTEKRQQPASKKS